MRVLLKWNNKKNIAKNNNIPQQPDTEKPEWERDNREKYAWE